MKLAEEYIFNQPEPFKSILFQLQIIIENTLPEVVLLCKWRVPFYYIDKSPICYLNVTKGYVDVVFWGAQYFTEHLEKLESDKRKYVKSLRYRSIEDIDQQVLECLLKQADRYKNERFITK